MLARWIKKCFQVATVRVGRLALFSRAGFYRRRRAQDQSALRLRIREIAHARPRFGYQHIHVMLRREGWPVNKKRVRRLYWLDGLQLRTRSVAASTCACIVVRYPCRALRMRGGAWISCTIRCSTVVRVAS